MATIQIAGNVSSIRIGNAGGIPVANLTVSESKKNRDGGYDKTYFQVAVWGEQQVNFVSEWFKEGSPILVNGVIEELGVWEKKSDGTIHPQCKVRSNNVSFAPREVNWGAKDKAPKDADPSLEDMFA